MRNGTWLLRLWKMGRNGRIGVTCRVTPPKWPRLSSVTSPGSWMLFRVYLSTWILFVVAAKHRWSLCPVRPRWVLFAAKWAPTTCSSICSVWKKKFFIIYWNDSQIIIINSSVHQFSIYPDLFIQFRSF